MLMMQQHLDRAAIHNPIKNRNETVNSPLKRDNIEHEHPPLLVKNYFLQYIAPWLYPVPVNLHFDAMIPVMKKEKPG